MIAFEILIPQEVAFCLILIWLFVLGAVLGSFLNVCVYRIPQHERLIDQLRGLVSPGSHCPRCKAPIRKSDNLPIIGWIRLKGRCRNCGGRISFRYPLIEFLNGLLFVLVYWLELPHEFSTHAWESSTWSPLGPHLVGGLQDVQMLHLRYFYHLVLLEALFVASLIDLDTMTIPDASTLPAMAVGLIGAVALGQMYLVPVWFQDPALASFAPEWARNLFGQMVAPPPQFAPGVKTFGLYGLEVPAWTLEWPHLHGLAVSAAGLVIGGGLVWGVRLAGFWTLRREAMGFGDVILMALVGSFLGWQPTLVAFFIAPFFAMLITAGRWVVSLFSKSRLVEMQLPYGPYLSLSALVVVVCWKWMWPIVGRWFSAGPLVPLMGLALLVLMIPALFFIQFIKWLLGIPLYPEPQMQWEEVWTSADTLTYLAGEVVERDRQQWTRANEWPGEAAAQGMIFEERWRSRDTATGWPD